MTQSIITKLQARFDQVPDHVVKTIAEAALAEAGITARTDAQQVRYDSDNASNPALERSRAYADQAAADVSQQWKGGAK